MRKGLTIISVLALVLVGFLAMANPAAACKWEFKKEITPIGPSEDNNAIPMGVNQGWELLITLSTDIYIKNIYIKDRLGGELEVDGVWEVTHGNLIITEKGKTDKVFIDWYIPELQADSVAYARMWISTDINPGGQQEYTSPGPHQMNSGAVLKYEDACGNKFTETTDEIWVNVVP